MVGIGNAQVLILNSTETLAVPTAAKLDLRNININVTNKTITVTYRFLSSGDIAIPIPGGDTFNRTWTCFDRDAELVANCTGVGIPYPCCTGVGTGTGCNPGSTCFTDTFSYVIKGTDNGTVLGKGLRALIWNKMRPDVLTGTNNATLP